MSQHHYYSLLWIVLVFSQNEGWCKDWNSQMIATNPRTRPKHRPTRAEIPQARMRTQMGPSPPKIWSKNPRRSASPRCPTKIATLCRGFERFKKLALASKGRSGSEYVKQLLADTSNYYGYNGFLTEELLNLLPVFEIQARTHF
ncbi:hypothetical protein FRB93_000596 [Tulasnella sp. JGI-2019a]|nr:hypothetical protein FRB93_000596 [Tulasnella sp. JGI-2019a]